MARFTNSDLTLTTMQKTVTTSGSPVQLHAGYTIPDGILAVIKAKSTNTGLISIGNTSALAANNSGKCYNLSANQAIGLQVFNLQDIWLDCTVNGEGVDVIFEKQIVQANAA